jgi:cysteine desulfurase
MDIDAKYFDYAASSPVWPEALEAFIEMSQHLYANPSSRHSHGQRARAKMLDLKKVFCDSLQFYDGRLLFCASGSEANNTIVEGHLNLIPNAKLLVAENVHDSIWYATEKHPKSVRKLKIDEWGQIKLQELERSLKDNITLVCISHVCHETGVIQPVRELSELCMSMGVRVLIDGVQAVGHVPVNINEIPCTYYTLSGHKFGSVRSAAGALIRDSKFDSLIRGGSQEWNHRAGTENVGGLASMVSALKKSMENLDIEIDKTKALVELLKSRLKSITGLLTNTPVHSAPGILSLSFPGMIGREMVGALSLAGFATSTGSACHENEVTPSRIMVKMGRSTSQAKGTVRISMGRGTNEQAVNELADELLAITQK